MKLSFVFLFLVFSLGAHAEETFLSPINQTASEFPEMESGAWAPADWEFNVGMSQFNGNSANSSGKGLNFEVSRGLGEKFAINAGFTTLKLDEIGEIQNPDFTYSQVTTRRDVSFGTLALEFRPVEVNSASASFFAGVTAGSLNTLGSYDTSDTTSTVLLGASVGLNFKNQVGLKADYKTANKIGALSTVSLVGYY